MYRVWSGKRRKSKGGVRLEMGALGRMARKREKSGGSVLELEPVCDAIMRVAERVGVHPELWLNLVILRALEAEGEVGELSVEKRASGEVDVRFGVKMPAVGNGNRNRDN